ncbi:MULTISPECIES: GNAT family N-acetyltransferase [unclassified Streptomyces]|uniref:GNAT family N-acetyltransferase n=1 Tax=unclassified Streptomyces TaxID=2593676 RepID=UPI000DB971B8|nr:MULTISPECIES: GNAT family N-acetyltransferase [unclassified Streptomyces]MYT71385.1 GNAT family N-acetyltransferase [Streptomyces sp. SID8367]RAJ82845.1 acetyltransferase (GNAT) family protein [Streptomyces sp. PsTaAH-137]
MRIVRATSTAQLHTAAALFDTPPREEWAAEFLAAPGHHLYLAHADDEPAGFVSGVETVHPDKGREMFLYELAVAEPYRRRGIARALVRTLADLAAGLGCHGMWVGVDLDNDAALATYRSAGGTQEGPCQVIAWHFAGPAESACPNR